MFLNAQQRYIASHPGLSNPLCITVGFSGLENEFDSLTSHAGGEEWETSQFVQPIIPYQVEAVQNARGIFDENANGIVSYGGRGWAVPARVEPEVMAYGIGNEGFNRSGGQGGEFAVTLEPVADQTDPTKTSHWQVATATATAGVGSGYSSSGFVVVAVGESICGSPPSITLGVSRGPPRLTARPNTAACNCNGSGAEFQLTYTQSGSGNSATWAVSSVQVLNGGSGYPASGSLAFTAGLDGGGGLPVATFQSTAGVITSVSVGSGGTSYTNGVPTGVVTVSSTSRGAYYKEDRSLPAYTYSQYSSQHGLVVDADLDSDTFGQVTQGPPQGEGGPPYQCRNGCLASYNGREHLLCTVIDNFGVPASASPVSLCVVSPWGQGGEVRLVVPPGYDNGPTGIAQVEVESAGSGYAVRGRSQPSPVFSAFPGSGASFSSTLTEVADSAGRIAWSVESVGVTGGSGYQDRSGVFMSSANNPGIGGNFASGQLNTKRIAPTLSAVPCPGSGSGASLAVLLTPTESDLPVWNVSAVTVEDGGSGYEQGAPVTFSVTSPSTRTVRSACAYLQVDEAGAIVSVVVVASKQGEYYRHTDEPHSVSFDVPGTGRGVFFLNDDTKPAIVAPLEVKVAQNEWFSQGAGAVIVAGVETNPSSSDFGKIVAASIQNPGSGYVLRSATAYGVERARLLQTRENGLPESEGFRLAPFADTEASISYFNGYANAGVNYTIAAHITAPDCNGIRKAEVLLSEPGYTTDRGMRTDVPCRRAFVGEGDGSTINLNAADGLPGVAYIRLEGDGGGENTFEDVLARDRNCDGRRQDDCNICRPPRLQVEGSTSLEPRDAIFRLYPVLGDCTPQDPNDPPSQQRPAYWVNLDDDGNVVSWYKVCGSCPPGYNEVVPTQSPEVIGTSYVRTACECYSDGFCFWKPVWDQNITPTLIDGEWTNCGDGTVEFDKTTCQNPLP